MPREKLYDQIRHGFPKESNDGKSDRTVIEYVGLEKDLRRECPILGYVWGEYLGVVADAQIDPLEGTEHAILSVTCELKLDQKADVTGSKHETSYDINWVAVQKPLLTHREFNEGGAYELSDKDRVQIDKWKNYQPSNDDGVDEKSQFRYENTSGNGIFIELSTNAKYFAAGYLLGIEYFDFFAPVARKTETFTGGPSPDDVAAGIKNAPTGFPNLPDGYEWLKSTCADNRAADQFRWTRTTEWTGGDKIYVDAEGVFWDAPT